MGMDDPIPQFSHLVSSLKERHPKLAYIHVVEPISGKVDRVRADVYESNDFLREIWQPSPYITAGGYVTRENAVKVADEKGGLIAFGRMYISNVSLCAIRLNDY
jgi:NADPH2 dehydrogenase